MVGVLDSLIGGGRPSPMGMGRGVMGSSVMGSVPGINMRGVSAAPFRPFLGPQPVATGQLDPRDFPASSMLSRGLMASGGAAQAPAARPQGLLGSIRSGLGGMSEEMALGLAGSLLGGPTRTPTGFGTKILQGLQAGREAEKAAEQQALLQRLTEAQISEAMGKGGEKQFKKERDLKKDFDSLSKDFRLANAGYEKVKQAATATDPTGVDDLALIFAYMKTIDPTSVVREGEFSNAENSGGVGNRVRNLYNSVLFGNRLTDAQRDNFLKSAKGQLKSQYDSFKTIYDQYEGLANQYSLNADNVVTDYLTDKSIIKSTAGGLDIEQALGDVPEIPGGSPENPLTPTDKNPVNRLPSGTYYLLPDGRVAQKE